MWEITKLACLFCPDTVTANLKDKERERLSLHVNEAAFVKRPLVPSVRKFVSSFSKIPSFELFLHYRAMHIGMS